VFSKKLSYLTLFSIRRLIVSKKTVGIILMVGGVLLAALSLGADLIGVGSYPGIDWAQLTGGAVGLALFIFGFWYGRQE
jgi:hypothetical protein